MSDESKHIELFDKYLQDLMTPEERLDFEKQLATDKAMASDFEIHKILLEGIKESGRQELKTYLKTNGTVLFWGNNVWPKSMRFAAAAVFIIMAGLYIVIKSYVKTPENREIAVEQTERKDPTTTLDTLVFDKLSKEDAKDHTEVVPSPPAIEAPEPDQLQIEESMDEAPIQLENEYNYSDVVELKNSEAEEDMDFVEVLSEKKLKDTLVKAPILLAMLTQIEATRTQTVQNKPASAGSTSTDGLYKKKAKQLPSNVSNQVQSNKLELDAAWMDTATSLKGNAEIKKVEDKTKLETSKTYIVEFWSSPINFKGYTLVNNYLKLYGLDSKQSNWYVYENNLYIREKNNVYLLKPCQESCPFKMVTDTAIKNYILQQK
ncbi:MAG: hypothetical protein R2852_06250 [Bacteroidia bacterium]